MPPLKGSLRIYEAHVGMAVEEQRLGTYREFAADVLPRIASAGYNAVELMAIQEHPYYGSFGYQVSNFFAVSTAEYGIASMSLPSIAPERLIPPELAAIVLAEVFTLVAFIGGLTILFGVYLVNRSRPSRAVAPEEAKVPVGSD